MANPYKNTGKCGTSPVKHVNTAGSIDHTHNGNPHPPGFENNEDIVEFPNDLGYQGGSVPGMFAIPMGLYHRYQDHKKHLAEQVPQPGLDKSKIEAMKYTLPSQTTVEETPPGAPSGDPDMKI
tara:strand:- start:720 stop:1088 length:369 start_codon:yes stop_codon:yes gene_type:complete